MSFKCEADFEDALVNILTSKGWNDGIIMYPSEEDLLANWAQILYENNNTIDRLNGCPLTETEMQSILDQIKELRTPLKLNGFINGKTISVKRDNQEDTLHYGKEISLKIYDRSEIAAGQSRYQIARQPKFKAKTPLLNDRRGDITLLINGMPLIHIELKNSGTPVSQACNQIQKYSDEGIFSGLFSLVQIFVAMEPNETVYFANPGIDGKFNDAFYFHWADFNNNPINDWKLVADRLLSIPMAHMMIGFYTVADNTDGILKVMRSYQYYAASGISEKVSKADWSTKNTRGGYIWHTTGSGKTMTSFKSAQLIANSKDADKVVFLMDRIELGTQSLLEYRGFAGENEEVQATENTGVLITKLKKEDLANTLIVTSIQKMSNIKAEGGLKQKDLEIINKKRIVFVVDECHRSTFGDMLVTIKETFPTAMFFGFTGTPILEENQKKLNTTATIFGDEIHRYSIADGIRDGNVLGFDPYKVLTYKDKDLREKVALEMAKAKTVSDALSNPEKAEVYNHYMREVKMYGSYDSSGAYIKGIEDYVPKSQYDGEEQGKKHREAVVEDIADNWENLSQNGKYHAIFATSSIPEAILYYRLIKRMIPYLKISALFDPNIDNNGGVKFKEDGLVEIIDDYKNRYGQDFSIPTYDKFKKDIALRLAHKKPYERIEKDKDKQIDLLIVVDQMLTGFDSKWINTLYMDKVLQYQNIIQAFSRTNRIASRDKPFGTIRYYRYPHTMEQNINKAVKLYSGDKPFGLFVDKLEQNIMKMNQVYADIEELFMNAGIQNFEKLPDEPAEKGIFVKLFNQFNTYLEAAKLQGFSWKKSEYTFAHNKVKCFFDKNTYLTLVLRYKEITGGGGGVLVSDVPYDIDTHITEIETDDIDNEYMNSRFVKFCKLLDQPNVSEEEMQNVLDEIHKSFASLSQEEQKYAQIFLNDVQSGNVVMEENKTFREYITEYLANAKNDQIHKMSEAIGVDEGMLRNFMLLVVNENNINEFGRFDGIKATADIAKAKEYFLRIDGESYSPAKLRMRIDSYLRKFILEGGFEV